MTKYHVTSEGPKRCEAKTDESCKYAGSTDHFSNKDDAQKAYEEQMSSKSSVAVQRSFSYSIPETHEEYVDGITYRVGSLYSERANQPKVLRKSVEDEVKRYIKSDSRLNDGISRGIISFSHDDYAVYVHFDPLAVDGLEPRRIEGTPYFSYDDVITDSGSFSDLTSGIRNNPHVGEDSKEILSNLESISSSFMKVENLGTAHYESSTPVVVKPVSDYARSMALAELEIKASRGAYKNGDLSKEELESVVDRRALEATFFLTREQKLKEMHSGKGDMYYESPDDVDREIIRQIDSGEIVPSFFLVEHFRKKAGIK